ncbi:MAG: ester cyclase [Maribacter sp.]|nr:ester cyclase [Maribacter sp.]
MRKISTLILAVILFTACQQGPTRYTQNSPEIDTVKQLIANYNSKTYDTNMYADTSKTFYNTKENPMTPAETMAYHQETDKTYSSRRFLDKGQEYEMVLTDDGKTWVNCWLDWEGTLAATNDKYDIPIHLTYQFIDGKIVREHGHWDPTVVVLAMQEFEAQMNSSVEEKTIRAAIDAVTNAWNANDKSAMASSMTANFIRTENGNIIAKNPKDYAGFMDVYHGAFPDFTVKIDKTVINGNMAYLNWTCTGTNTGNFMDNDPTNKKIETHGFSVWTFDSEGKSVREDAFYDNLVVFNQLGLTPPK